MIQDLVVTAVFVGYAVAVLLLFGTVLTWVERKQAAIMSDRIGANRAYVRIPFTQVKLIWLGLFHGLADGIKMMLKEDFRPNSYDRFAYALAPWVVFTPVLLVFAVIPFGGMLVPSTLFERIPSVAAWFGDRTYPMQIARVDAGLLVVFAFGGLTIIGTMLAGWSSSNKFSLLGALRAGSQMISYELIMGLTVLGLIVIYGTVDLDAIAREQSGMLLGFLPAWGVFVQPFAAVLFLTAAIAENKRIPFDLPEGRVGAHRGLLHRVQRDEDGPFHVRRIHRDRDHRSAFHHTFSRRLQPAVHDRRGVRLAGRPRVCRAAWRDRPDPARRVPRQGDAGFELPDPCPLVTAALSLGSAAAFRMEIHVSARAREPARDRSRRMDARKLTAANP
jgi:NADH:ubiquinone oxidoreductase subunit H